MAKVPKDWKNSRRENHNIALEAGKQMASDSGEQTWENPQS